MSSSTGSSHSLTTTSTAGTWLAPSRTGPPRAADLPEPQTGRLGRVSGVGQHAPLRRRWPKDPRLKECGTLMGSNFVEGVEGFTAALFRDVLGWRQEEVTVLNAGVRAAAKDKSVHPLFNVLVITGQKPL
ncbi:TdiE [Verticillium alfalfae VaMs.102]|uniref:TdiE n=1 Tax=Verticillium alfalfae (strain VaMs.102 / ATCC MYA-4576 / FGSC 10136) TaxID=526221 RepID=C9SA34_VERA1|nr:TdiE [Verticillium alfalfae VaMs.102]EEY16247.1 TdiE [Verticillium alfalfae VaMs.102]